MRYFIQLIYFNNSIFIVTEIFALFPSVVWYTFWRKYLKKPNLKNEVGHPKIMRLYIQKMIQTLKSMYRKLQDSSKFPADNNCSFGQNWTLRQ